MSNEDGELKVEKEEFESSNEQYDIHVVELRV